MPDCLGNLLHNPVGWANSEGAMTSLDAQGHYGGGINDSISKGAVPTTGGTSKHLVVVESSSLTPSRNMHL